MARPALRHMAQGVARQKDSGMTRRRKAAAIDAPTTLTEATASVVRYAELEREVARLQAIATERVAGIEEECALAVAAVEEQLKPLFKEIATWWAANQTDLTKGKRRSIEIAGVTLGDRRTPPSLKLPKGVTAAEMIAKLMTAKRGELVGVKYALDKPAIIKLLGQPDDAPALTGLGLRLDTKDEFFIATGSAEQPVDMDQADPLTVA